MQMLNSDWGARLSAPLSRSKEWCNAWRRKGEKWTVGHSRCRRDGGDDARVPFVICSIQYAYVELINYEWCTQKRERKDLLLSGHLAFVIRATYYHTIGADCLTPAVWFWRHHYLIRRQDRDDRLMRRCRRFHEFPRPWPCWETVWSGPK